MQSIIEELWNSSKKSDYVTSSQGGLNIIWVDQNINSNSNQKAINQILKVSIIKRLVPIDTVSTAMELISKKMNKINFIISNGSLGGDLVKSIYQKALEIVPYFQIFIYCFNVMKHKAWAINYGIILLVTNKIKEIINFIRGSSAHSLKKAKAQVIQPFSKSFIPLDFFLQEKHHYTQEKILEKLKSAAYSSNFKNEYEQEGRHLYSISEIENTIKTLSKSNYNLFKMYSTESFIHNEVNRRLLKYLPMISTDLLENNLNNLNKSHAFHMLKPIFPFVYEMVREMIKLNYSEKEMIYENGEVMRGLNLKPLQQEQFMKAKGSTIMFSGFTTTSFDLVESKRNMNTLYIITVPKKIPGENKLFPIKMDNDDYSFYPFEKEVIFPPCSLFKILNFEAETNRVLIYMEFVPEELNLTQEINKLPVQDTNKKYQSIVKDNKKITYHTLEKWKQLSPKLSQLKTLSLRNCNVDDHLFAQISDILFKNSALEIIEINLGNNQLKDKAVETLINLVPKLTHLKILDLNKNHINTEEALILAEKILSLPKLEILILESNPLSKAGKASLIKMALNKRKKIIV